MRLLVAAWLPLYFVITVRASFRLANRLLRLVLCRNQQQVRLPTYTTIDLVLTAADRRQHTMLLHLARQLFGDDVDGLGVEHVAGPVYIGTLLLRVLLLLLP